MLQLFEKSLLIRTIGESDVGTSNAFSTSIILSLIITSERKFGI